VDTIDHKVHDYLVKISVSHLNEKSAQHQSLYIDTIRDFERIADHAQNLFDFFEHRHDEKTLLSQGAEKDLKTLYDFVGKTLYLTIEAFSSDDRDLANEVMKNEDTIDAMVREYRKKHVFRLHEKPEEGRDDNLYVDILSNVERIGDHCNNIAINTIQESYYPDQDVLKGNITI
ncbi:MAG: PhoU domain-containing protein, partial [Bacillota bacterium]